MPKLKETAEQHKDNLVRAYIAKNMALYGFKDEQIAVKLHCTRQTFQSKKKRPETFILRELRKLCTILKLKDEEKALFI